MREPTDEFCKSDTGILVPECPSCIDKLFELVRKYQEQNIQLQSEIRQAHIEGAAEALEWAASMADEYAQRQQTGEISGVFGEMRIIRDAIRIEIERRKGGGE